MKVAVLIPTYFGSSTLEVALDSLRAQTYTDFKVYFSDDTPPTFEEERVADARLTVTVEDNNMICAMQKALSGSWTAEEVLRCIETARPATSYDSQE